MGLVAGEVGVCRARFVVYGEPVYWTGDKPENEARAEAGALDGTGGDEMSLAGGGSEGASRRRRRPSLDERDAFMLKLIEFRRELSPRQQRMLDAMALAAFCESDVDMGHYASRPLAELPRRREDTPWMNFLGTEW